jgi:predicted outer membrane repeat protein
MRRLLLALVCLLAVADTAVAATIRVPSEQPTIQAGIVAAAPGDTVLVASGTYYENYVSVRSGICLTSETGLSDCVTIDAQQQNRVLYCGEVDSLTNIVGFTITGGLAGNGAGMVCSSSSPRVVNCRFVGNRVHFNGGGIWCRDSSPSIADCLFEGNEAGSTEGRGGGIYCEDSSDASLRRCAFEGNQANKGGGMYCTSSLPRLTGCMFDNNFASSSGGDGGGICLEDSSSPALAGCSFAHNQARGRGGGMHCSESSAPTLEFCTFAMNQAVYHGGAVSCGGSSCPVLTACVIAFSQAGEAIYCEDSGDAPGLSCCDIYGNVGGDWVGCIAAQFGVDGNFCDDPLFCNMGNGDYTLCANSPCLPGSNDCGILVGAHGEGCDDCDSPMKTTSWSSIKATYR